MNTPQLNVVLYQPEIPQNTGNIGRTCVATDSKLWIVRPAGFRLDDRRLRRSGLDYWQHLSWSDVTSWSDLQAEAPPARTWLFSKRATRCYTDVAYQPGDFLVFGSETNGLPQTMIEEAGDRALRIPMSENVRSLNLANSVAIVVYEAVRQLDRSQPSSGSESCHQY